MVDEVSEFYTAKTASTSSASFLGTFPTGEGLDMCEHTALYDYFATPSLWKIYIGTALQPWQRLPALPKSDAPLMVSQNVS